MLVGVPSWVASRRQPCLGQLNALGRRCAQDPEKECELAGLLAAPARRPDVRSNPGLSYRPAQQEARCVRMVPTSVDACRYRSAQACSTLASPHE